MKAKALVITALSAIFFTCALIPANSWAGSPQSYRWEGVAIGVGAAIIGTALIKACQDAHEVAYEPPVHHRRPPAPAGHWETRQEWVPPVYEKRWNPDHYDRQGHWVPGHWIQIKTQEGYWSERRVWIPAR